jgi:Domain of unknown function (DUF4338)
VREFVRRVLPELQHHFAEGTDIDPQKVEPVLELIEAGTWQSDLFRLAGLSWSVPVSAGYGRRLRYLVWDRSNQKLIGIVGLGDPVFNLKARDDLVGWNVKDREKRLVNLLDAYVLGAVPPYNMILGGKLISCLVRFDRGPQRFRTKYGKTRGIISRKKKGAKLVVVTTSSSLGRSSAYNRLKLDDQSYFVSIGYTQGWGHFHIPDRLFAELRDYLRKRKHKYVDGHRFGQGPNWRLRTIRVAFDTLGFRVDLLKHGIGREVFLCRIGSARGGYAQRKAVATSHPSCLPTLLLRSEVLSLRNVVRSFRSLNIKQTPPNRCLFDLQDQTNKLWQARR